MRLKDKVAIITGAGSGQGKAAAQLFAREGAKIVVAEWNEEAGANVAKSIQEEGGTALFIKVDVSDEDAVRSMVNQVIDLYGQIDVLFNNAGIGFSANSRYKMASILETPLQDWNAIIGINLNGTYLVSKYVVPVMRNQKRGSIINNSSLNGIIGESGADAYTASKGGIVALTRVMAVDYGKNNIRVNCICPGAIETPMIAAALELDGVREHYSSGPLGRIGKPEEIAYAALFLASDEASYITGIIMPVDGGWSTQ